MKKRQETLLRNTKIFLNDIVDTAEHKCVLDEVRVIMN